MPSRGGRGHTPQYSRPGARNPTFSEPNPATQTQTHSPVQPSTHPTSYSPQGRLGAEAYPSPSHARSTAYSAVPALLPRIPSTTQAGASTSRRAPPDMAMTCHRAHKLDAPARTDIRQRDGGPPLSLASSPLPVRLRWLPVAAGAVTCYVRGRVSRTARASRLRWL